jgi:RNA polymerase sigma-70 factor, ECF subfamily
MITPTEQDLLQGAKTYDLNALGVIYDQYSPGIYRYAMRLLGDDCLAEDCVAETFSRFLKVLQSGQGPKSHLQAYLYRIAHNWITDSYRRQSPLLLELVESSQVEDLGHLEKQTETRLEQEKVRLALRSLTPDQCKVITLRFLEGWGNEEVAATLEKPVGAIKALQHRALETLRRMLM